MKNRIKQIIPSLWLAASFGFPVAVSAQVLTPSQLQQINSGLFRSNSQDFFLRGNRQLEQELKVLSKQRLNSEVKILEIEKKKRSERCHPDFKISSRNFETIKE
ncbi:MAG: hypothetical protein P2A85_07745 [Microcoleus anatoxicus]|uniref:hypothetical protein n=1 Tax=Microcoleus anatoxicus TaxID=2705319 RepID=UPI003672C842